MEGEDELHETEVATGQNDQIEEFDEHDETEIGAPDPDYEREVIEARQGGWVPKDEWRGNPDDWRDAPDFNKRGREILPYVRRQLDEEREARESERKEFEQRIERLQKMQRKSLERMRDRDAAAFGEAKRYAVERGDTDTYDRLSKEEQEALKAYDDDPSEEDDKSADDPLAHLPPADRSTIESWASANQAWANDPVVGGYCGQQFQRIRRESPGMPVKDQLAEAEQMTRRKFPEAFGISRSRPDAVEGSNGRGAARSHGGRFAAKLPPEAKAAFRQDVEDGIYKPDEIEAYAKEYFGEDAR